AADRRAALGAGGGAGDRGERARGGDPVPPRDPHRRRSVGLSLGRGAQARAAGSRGSGIRARGAVTALARAARGAAAIGERVAAIDWPRVAADLDARGAATVERLLAPAECGALAALYDEGGDAEDGEGGGRFRSRVVMAAHGFGRGEYKYFAYPLPALVAELRASWYPHLAPIANRWSAELGRGPALAVPDDHASYLARCHA